MNVLQLLVEIGYIGGLVLLPVVLYIMYNERLGVTVAAGESVSAGDDGERNHRTGQVLDGIRGRLDIVTNDEGEELLQLNDASQAAYLRRGLQYIFNTLKPTDQAQVEYAGELAEYYNNRVARVFTGSFWLMAFAIGIVVVLFLIRGASFLASGFFWLHVSGILFYVLSCRVNRFVHENRLKTTGGGPGLLSGIVGSLFMGDNTKHYVKSGDGPWRRDYGTENEKTIFGWVLLIVLALFLAFLVSFVGIVNFILNYARNLFTLLPFSNEVWYRKNFGG
jgi:hypothetical protein